MRSLHLPCSLPSTTTSLASPATRYLPYPTIVPDRRLPSDSRPTPPYPGSETPILWLAEEGRKRPGGLDT